MLKKRLDILPIFGYTLTMARFTNPSDMHSKIAASSSAILSSLRQGSSFRESVPTTSQRVGLAAGALLFIVLMLTPKHAKAADPWTTRDTVLQGSVLGLMWIDYRQTLEMTSGKNPKVMETNPALGRYPTREDVTQYFVGAAIVHTALVAVLPKDWRLALQAGAIGVELSAVSRNYRLGIAIRF